MWSSQKISCHVFKIGDLKQLKSISSSLIYSFFTIFLIGTNHFLNTQYFQAFNMHSFY
ncbi:MAG: hypothetical protein RLZZ337_1497 [Bacteroidota bacterium]|jgi:uncharacterized protein (DUF486 family)